MTETEKQKATEKERDKHLDQKYATFASSSEKFDKSILAISSGALGVSFAFIEKIIPILKDAEMKNLLIISWSLFVITIFVSLVSHFMSVRANYRAIQNHNKPENIHSDEIEKSNKIIRWMNISMIFSLLLGCVTLLIFISKNL